MQSINKWILCAAFYTCLTGCMSKHFWEEERFINLEQDLQVINCMTIPTGLKLTLDDVIHIALEYNQDLLLKDKEYGIQLQTVLREQLKMLPQLIANAEESERNNELIVSSVSVVPGVPPAPPSISTQRHVKRYDVNIIFNLLDFGLSYYKAQEESKRVLVVALEYERMRQTLIVDVLKQYWKAIASKVAMDEAESMLGEVVGYQYKVGEQISTQYVSKLKGLKTQIDLTNIQIQFNEFRQDYENAISELTLLMGMPPSVKFELDYDPDRPLSVELPDIFTLEGMALTQRPELYSKDVEEKISEDEARYAFLEMLPGAELFAGTYFDANKFFRFHHWIVAGARATWNLLAVPNRFVDNRIANQRTELVRMRRVALSVAVLSQVRLAYILYKEDYDQYLLFNSLENSNRDLLLSAQDGWNGGAVSRSEVLFIHSQAVLAKRNALKAYGELQISLEQLNHAIGAPRYYKNIQTICE